MWSLKSYQDFERNHGINFSFRSHQIQNNNRNIQVYLKKVGENAFL